MYYPIPSIRTPLLSLPLPATPSHSLGFTPSLLVSLSLAPGFTPSHSVSLPAPSAGEAVGAIPAQVNRVICATNILPVLYCKSCGAPAGRLLPAMRPDF